jgi:tagaturonate reductase
VAYFTCHDNLGRSTGIGNSADVLYQPCLGLIDLYRQTAGLFLNMISLPETVLQFGTGKFLRAFADLFIHQANEAGQAVGAVVAVQSTGAERTNLLNRQHGRYHVLVRGLVGGAAVDRVEPVASVHRALVASEQWPEVLAVARSSELRYVLSNTAEQGYTLHPHDGPADAPPRSFPARLLVLLSARYGAGRPGVDVLPCELFEHNGRLLLDLLLQLARSWGLGQDFQRWLQTECRWHNTLVDRIVALGPLDDHPLARTDALLTVAEPFAFWAVEVADGASRIFEHPAIHQVPDVHRYFLRKVRILNAAHTALVCKALPRGIATVREAVVDPEIRAWLEGLLFEEIVPVLEGRVEAPAEFARQTLERFLNPFLRHKMSDVATYHDARVRIRLVPTRDEFRAKFGRTPPRLDQAITWSAATPLPSV